MDDPGRAAARGLATGAVDARGRACRGCCSRRSRAGDLLSAAWSASAEDAVVEFDRTSLYLGHLRARRARRAPRTARRVDRRARARDRRDRGRRARQPALPGLVPGPRAARAAAVGEHAPELPGRLLERARDPHRDRGAAARPLGCSPAAGRAGCSRSAVVPALGAVLYLTSSRGAVAATALGTLVLVVAHPRRLAALGSRGGRNGRRGASRSRLVASRHAVVDGPLGSAAARSEGREAAVAVVVICVATAAGFEWLRRVAPRLPAPGRGVRRLVVAVVVVLAVAAAAYGARSFGSFTRLPPTTGVGRHRRRAPPERQRQRPLAVLDGRARRVPELAAPRRRPRVVRGVVGPARVVPLLRQGRPLALRADARRARDRGLRCCSSRFSARRSRSGYAGSCRPRRRSGRRSRRCSARSPSICSAPPVDWMWELTVVTAVGLVLLALLAGPSGAAEETAAPAARAARAGLAVAAALFAAAELVVLLADVEVGRSQTDAAAGRYGAARAAALAATRLEPWAASPYLQLALVEESRGEFAAGAAGDRPGRVPRRPRLAALAREGADRRRPRPLRERSGEPRAGEGAQPALARRHGAVIRPACRRAGWWCPATCCRVG